MARSKKHLYPIEDQLVSESAKALFQPTRLKVIRLLINDGTQCVKEITKGHPISQEAMTDHLNQLYRKNLITSRERYPYTFYTIEKQNTISTLKEIIKYANEMLNSLEVNGKSMSDKN